MGNSSQLFADKFNKHVNSFRAIQADQTRTRAEKSALLSKLEKSQTGNWKYILKVPLKVI